MEIHIVSDFNIELLGRYVEADHSLPKCRAVVAPYGQAIQSLNDPSATGSGNFGFVWTRPEGVISEFAKIYEGEKIDTQRLFDEVTDFAEQLRRSAEKYKVLFVASWVRSAKERGLGMLDWTKEGHAYLLAKMNVLLADIVRSASNIYLLDAGQWIETAQPNARDPKYWFAMKTPFTEGVFLAAARDIKAALRANVGLSRKVIAVDLDDTLWGGIVGDDGWENLNLGGHDHIGEAYVEFQKALKTLTQRGIQVVLVSKNDEATALAAVDRHPEMILRRKDIAGWRINWMDKAQNIVELAEELNLGLQSFVFIDNNPAERGRIREALPDVLVPEWPKLPTRYAEALRLLDCFDQPSITGEDRSRTQMYVEERNRKHSSVNFSSAVEWLKSLDIQITIAPITNSNIKRSVQLLNKTNQMNLSGRRLVENELGDWIAAKAGREMYALSVADRFGDLGLTGIISWEQQGQALAIADFVLSCRAMGRKVENTMLHLAWDAARKAQTNWIIAHAIPTKRNGPCLEFWRNSGFSEPELNVFHWRTDSAYPKPDCVSIKVEQAPRASHA